jgi:hypothetical protein
MYFTYIPLSGVSYNLTLDYVPDIRSVEWKTEKFTLTPYNLIN